MYLMKLDIFEIINAAKTNRLDLKLFIQPRLRWTLYSSRSLFIKVAKQLNFETKFVKLSGEINTQIIYTILKQIKK